MTALFVLVGLALVFGFLNGIHDSSNIVATIIASRSMSPRMALTITAIAEFIGPFLFGLAVARTIGEGLVSPQAMTLPILMAALAGSIGWNIFTWRVGIPSSSSHALIGGILGAVVMGAGREQIIFSGLAKVLLALSLSPFAGLVVGYLLTKLVYLLARNSSLRVNWFFKNAQIVTGMGLALSHGANDAQKIMGIISLGLFTAGLTPAFEVPFWVIAVSAMAIAVGTATGGWSLIRTVGGKFYKIRPVNGFCAQAGSATVILAAALLGGPVSTTQVVSSTVVGAGAAERFSKVRWGVMGNIVIAWLLTIPATGLLSAGVYLGLRLLF